MILLRVVADAVGKVFGSFISVTGWRYRLLILSVGLKMMRGTLSFRSLRPVKAKKKDLWDMEARGYTSLMVLPEI